MAKLDLSIIIISFNTRDLTVSCIESIRDHTKGISYEIIVVDNASKDDSVEKLSNFKFHHKAASFFEGSQISNFKLIVNKENAGFSKANNIGIKESSGRHVLFLNSDTLVPEKTLETMVKFMDEHAEAGAATCFVRMPNGELDDASHRGFPTPWNAIWHFSGVAKMFPKSMFFNGYHLGWRELNKTHEIDALAGAFMIVRREAGEEVTWWDEDYFFYGEDIDFCYQLKEHGWKIYFVPEVEILHYKGASGGIKKESEKITTANTETKRWATKQRFDAMSTFYKKHYLKRYPRIITWLILLAIGLKKKKALSMLS